MHETGRYRKQVDLSTRKDIHELEASPNRQHVDSCPSKQSIYESLLLLK